MINHLKMDYTSYGFTVKPIFEFLFDNIWDSVYLKHFI